MSAPPVRVETAAAGGGPNAGCGPLRRRRLIGCGIAALAVWPSPAACQRSVGEQSLRVALVPYLSARAMLTRFGPLREHLAASLGRPVDFYTASSFAALLDSVRSGRQPFTLMPMHLARIAVADWGHVLVARSSRVSAVELLAPRSLGLGQPQTLRGRRVAAIDPLSITSLMLTRWLHGNRLDGAVQVVGVPTVSAAAAALGRGEVDAIVAAQGQSLDVPWLKPDELVVVATLGEVYSPCFIALRDVPAAELAAFRGALLGFTAPAGRTGASGAQFVEGSPRDLEPYEGFAADVRRLLAAGARPRS